MNYKILELNIGNPSLERAKKQINWMKNNNYDIYVLTETKNSEGCNYIEKSMKILGYQVVFPKPNGKNLGVMIISRVCLQNIDFVIDDSDELFGRLIKCHIKSNDYKFDLLGIYVPSRDRSEKKVLRKKRFCDIVIKALSNNKNNMILCGDYNVVSVNHIPHYPVYYQWEYQFLQELQELEFIDVYEMLHPNKQEYSWMGRTGNGYRYDYIHSSKQMFNRISKCDYIHATREGEQKITDHSGICVEIYAKS